MVWLGPAAFGSSSETSQGVEDEFWHPGRTRCQEDPLRLIARGRRTVSGKDFPIAMDEGFHFWNSYSNCRVVGNDGIGFRGFSDGGQIFQGQVGGTQSDTTGYPVQFEDRGGSSELVCGRDQNRLPGQLIATAAECRTGIQIAECES